MQGSRNSELSEPSPNRTLLCMHLTYPKLDSEPRPNRTLIGIVLIRQFNLAKQGGGCQGMRVVGDSGGGKQRVACVLSTQRLWRNRREPWRRANRKKNGFGFMEN